MSRVNIKINREFLNLYAIAAGITFVIGMIFWMFTSLADSFGQKMDYTAFWAASYLFQNGKAVSAFNLEEFNAAMEIAKSGENKFLWSYPPTIAPLIWPIALIPFKISYILWCLLSVLVLGLSSWLITKDRLCTALAIVSPFAMHSLLAGQNGIITGCLLSFGFYMLLKQKDTAAGILFGLLLIKPHLGILIPAVLLLSKRWRAFFVASVTALLLIALSTMITGVEYWEEFLKSLEVSQYHLSEGLFKLSKMLSVYASVRPLFESDTIPFIIHGVTALSVSALALFMVFKHGITEVNVAAVIIASVLISPYIYDYDASALLLVVYLLSLQVTNSSVTNKNWQMPPKALKTALIVLYFITITYHSAIAPYIINPVPFILIGLLSWIFYNHRFN